MRALRGMAAPGAAPGFMVELERTYPVMAHMRLMGEHAYALTDPAAIVEVFIDHGRQTMKGRGLQGAKAVLGNGLLTSEGEVHLRNRRLVQPAFHRDRIAGYAADMVTLTEAHEDTWTQGRTLDMQADMAALTLARRRLARRCARCRLCARGIAQRDGHATAPRAPGAPHPHARAKARTRGVGAHGRDGAAHHRRAPHRGRQR